MSLELKLDEFAEKPSDFLNDENKSSTETYINISRSHNIIFEYDKEKTKQGLPIQNLTVAEERGEGIVFRVFPSNSEYDIDIYVFTNLHKRQQGFNNKYWDEVDLEEVEIGKDLDSDFETVFNRRRRHPPEWITVPIDNTYNKFIQYNPIN